VYVRGGGRVNFISKSGEFYTAEIGEN